jgi:hypothetical protein
MVGWFWISEATEQMLIRQEGKCECSQGDCANSQSAERIKCNGK